MKTSNTSWPASSSLLLIAFSSLIDNSSKVWSECFVVEDNWKYLNSKGPTYLLWQAEDSRGNIPSMRQSTAGSSCTTLIDEFNCVEKRRKQREALSAAFADFSINCPDSPALELCYFSQELAHGAERSKKRIWKVSASSETEIGSFKPVFATSFINERDPIAEDVATHLTVDQESGVGRYTSGQSLLSGSENPNTALLKTRALSEE